MQTTTDNATLTIVYGDIRPYGRGKFDTKAGMVAFYTEADDIAGSSDTTGSYSLIRGPITPEQVGEGLADISEIEGYLTTAEVHWLAGVGFIAFEATDGSVTVERYDDPVKLELAWQDACDEVEEDEEDEEDEDEDEMEDPDRESEPQEEDLVTDDHRRFYRFGMTNRRPAVEVGEDEPWEPAVRAYMEREGFFPNVWWISDHGNAHRLDLDAA
jgi:hypothetical protein